MALVEALAVEFDRNLPSLFMPTPAEIRRELARLAGGDRFGSFARVFFARLTQKTLGYYLSRELANHTGPGLRFASDADRVLFDQALATHAWEASRIVEAFAGGWYGKTIWQGDGLTAAKTARFADFAFRKLCGELGRRRDAA